MTNQNKFFEYVVDLLSTMGEIRFRAMFGGYGIYKGDLMFALIANDVLYFKVDDINRPKFESDDLCPFVYNGGKKPIKMSYYEAPQEGLDDGSILCKWGEDAFEAALRSKKTKPKKKKKTKPKGCDQV